MTAFFVIPAVALGIWAALLLVGYAIMNIPCPYDRVAFFWTILATDVVAVSASYFLLGPITTYTIFSFTLTKCLVWCIMDPHKMVHSNVEE